MIQNNHSVAVPTRLECVNEGVTLFKKEAMIPLVNNICHLFLVDNPSLFTKFTCDFDRDLVIVTVWPRAFSVVVENPMTRTNSKWL